MLGLTSDAKPIDTVGKYEYNPTYISENNNMIKRIIEMSEQNEDFDCCIQRKGTNCLKYDFALRRGMPEDVLPFWVADMDFATSSYIQDALVKRAMHPIFGYSETDEEYFNAVAGWMKRHHEWEVQRSWLIKTPGVIFAVAMAIKAYTKPGDKVLIQRPLYYPFAETIVANNRVAISNSLYLGDDNRYHIDYEDFEKKIADNNIKLFLLCNPHNPSGRDFSKEELTKIGDICLKHNVIVVSDEIHNDFVFKGKHTVFASIKKEYEDICIVCTSASKTFNIATMLVSNIFIPNRDLKKRFKKEVEAAGISQLNIMVLLATQAAYEDGEVWYEAMYSYVKSNIEYVREYVRNKLPGVNAVDGEGTYLLWLDFRGTGIGSDEINKRIVADARLWLDRGEIFGEEGEGFQRINVATPRKNVTECLERIKKYVLQNKLIY